MQPFRQYQHYLTQYSRMFPAVTVAPVVAKFSLAAAFLPAPGTSVALAPHIAMAHFEEAACIASAYVALIVMGAVVAMIEVVALEAATA